MKGLFVCGREEVVPLRKIAVRAFMQGYVVGFRSTLTYQNSSTDPAEVFFRTRIDDSCAVVGLEACIDGRKIRAEVREKETAREMYDEAIASGLSAVYGVEKKGDIFSLVLGNLPAGEKAELQLTMVSELSIEPDGAVRFVLPKVLKPRYTPVGSSDPLAPIPATGSSGVHYASGPTDYQFDMLIHGASAIDQVTSPSHRINVVNAGQNLALTLAGEEKTDIVILVQPKEPHKPMVIVEPGLSNGKNDFQKSAVVMVSFFPEFNGDTLCLQAACEFVFVVDRSGSMAGSYIRDAAQTLLLFLKSIPEGCYFNVIGFGSSYEKLFPESVPYNQANMEKAVTHAENLEADLGGTELFEPLKYVFGHAPMKGLPRQVFVLTDGSIGNTESVIKLVAKNSNNSRVFSFGIGSGASTTLVKGIADAGKGAAEFITSEEKMQAKVIRSLKKAMQPAVIDVQVNFNLPNNFSSQVTSERVVFMGERLMAYGILHQPCPVASVKEGTVCLTGNFLGAKIAHKMKIEIPLPLTKTDDLQVTTIHYLAAKKMIKEMESSGGDEMKIAKLSCDSNVVSSLTAFVAIDKERKELVKGSLQRWDVVDVEPIRYGLASYSLMSSRVCKKKKSRKTLAASPPTYSRSQYLPTYSSSRHERFAANLTSFDSFESDFSDSYCEPSSLEYLGSGDKLSATKFTSADPMAKLINLQLACGAWNLTEQLAEVVKTSVNKIIEECPVSCDDEMKTVWATIIAISYLHHKQSDRKDEWELLVAKAETWLAKQPIAAGLSLKSLREKAVEILH